MKLSQVTEVYIESNYIGCVLNEVVAEQLELSIIEAYGETPEFHHNVLVHVSEAELVELNEHKLVLE